jgi:hypothetical protein
MLSEELEVQLKMLTETIEKIEARLQVTEDIEANNKSALKEADSS